MRIFSCLIFLLVTLGLVLEAKQAWPDIATPQRIKRSKQVTAWKSQYPKLQLKVEVSTAQANAISVHLQANAPVSYRLEIIDLETVGQGEITNLSGASVTETITLPSHLASQDHFLLGVYYTLKGVDPTSSTPKLTSDRITGCIIKSLVLEIKDGQIKCQERPLTTPEYHRYQRSCLL